MNIPVEVARAQGGNGIKGAVHGVKGGRPRLDLTDGERAERRRQQFEAYRRRQGIPPRAEALTWEERLERHQREQQERLNEEYRRVWHKLPGEPLTEEEFAKGERALRAWVRGCRDRSSPLYWPVPFVRKHYREEWRRERDEERQSPGDGSRQQAAEPKTRAHSKRQAWQRWVPPLPSVDATPSVGRNQPCPCGSGRKFKKCCGGV